MVAIPREAASLRTEERVRRVDEKQVKARAGLLTQRQAFDHGRAGRSGRNSAFAYGRVGASFASI
jgi:hypothetical protein